MEFTAAASVASRLERASSSPSTNAELRERAADAVGWPHLSVLLTDDQTAGRGRLDRQWVTPAGSALAVSVLLRDLPESADARGWIPLAAGVAMADAIATQLPGRRVGVKWPNDVLVEGRKICGILAEAAGDAVIVGSGVNTAMTAEQLPVETATSFAVHGVQADLDRLLADYLGRLDALIAGLRRHGGAMASGLHRDATARCVTLGEEVVVWLPGGERMPGTATRLEADGRLVVARGDGGVRTVAAGDVVHVRPAGSAQSV
ncbi:biotin--[acetyl-CoA-carboxylase] ligase [Microbacterium sp.]|uniref:biotin--[acetyl-CoA-carboxylase] ligase n=1 Tax=Microbacterium sp. TaxID=51671 RepID=UPI002812463F|nr:biotin--[acetyl-CoA-carboxylase] ligase [Microbacterium sp.]